MTNRVTNPIHRPCPLCGGRRASWLATLAGPGESERLLRCADCAMVFLDRPCAAAAERAYYADHIARTRFHRPTRAGFEAEYRRQLPVLDQTARLVLARSSSAGFQPAFPSRQDACATPRVLDVGCGNGFLLHHLSELGCRVRGIDLDATLAAFCRDELGLDVTVDDLENFASADSFDTVVMTDVLEHLPEPLAALQKVRALLAPGGAVLVKVPNWRVGRAHLWLGRDRARFQPNLHIQTEHLNYFSPRTLSEIFRRAEFARVEIFPAQATYEDAKTQRFGRIRNIQSALSAALPGRWAVTSCIFGIGEIQSKYPV